MSPAAERMALYRSLLADPVQFAQGLSGLRLRDYQKAVARAIAESVLNQRGQSFVVMFPRQSGKNELQAQLEAYLLARLSDTGGEIVKISPTWKPQSLNAMRRLERVLESNLLLRGLWQKENGYIYRVGRARIFFLSGAPEANIVGATASSLLEVDEAQDVSIAKFDKAIAPMAASTNATRVFWGTAWTSQTLLARELRAAGPNAFVLAAPDVAREVPAYAQFVAEQVQRLGRAHPLVRTQYFSEEIDGQGGLFPPERIAKMKGDGRPPLDAPEAGGSYALLVDVAGADENSGLDTQLANPRRDATALTVVRVDRSGLQDPQRRAPVYQVAWRRTWLGVPHSTLYTELSALADAWRARYVVIDATGVGAGLAGFLQKALPGRVIPFTFNTASKSKLGWDFLALVDGGRWQEPVMLAEQERLQNQFYRQLRYCQYNIAPGPARVMHWAVADGARDALSGEYVHDDLLLSAALSAVLDEQPWGGQSGGALDIVRAKDPLADMRRF